MATFLLFKNLPLHDGLIQILDLKHKVYVRTVYNKPVTCIRVIMIDSNVK